MKNHLIASFVMLCIISTTVYGADLSVHEVSDRFFNTVTQEVYYSDLQNVPWAEDAIYTLSRWGIVTGEGDGKFYPERDITRGEFAKMVTYAFGIVDDSAQAELTDSEPSDWHYKPIATMIEKGISKGYSDEYYGTMHPLLREEMAVIICRAAQMAGIEFSEAADRGEFNDASDISPYAREFVSDMKRFGLVKGGNDGNFFPRAEANRAECVVLIYNILKQIF